MTTHKSAAVTAGIMPDFAQAGVVLCRSGFIYTADDEIVSGDTIQMVPNPEGALVLQVQVYHCALPANTTGCDIGYGGDPDAFAATVTMTAADWKVFPGNSLEGNPGFRHIFTADDTVDITFGTLDTKLPTASALQLNVWYKMTGVLADEDDI